MVAALIVFGLFFTAQRHFVSSVPWLPGQTQRIWSVEAKISFTALGTGVKASIAIPSSQPGFEFIAERTASPGFGLG